MLETQLSLIGNHSQSDDTFDDVFLDVYGGYPDDLGLVELDSDNAEMCFVQYLPIKMPFTVVKIPEGLKWCEKLVDIICKDDRFPEYYIYLTVKKVYGSGNREGWHCDGFGTDDINYIWYDKHPTQFNIGEWSLPSCHHDSLKVMDTLPLNTVEYPSRHLIKMDQRCIHRVNPSSVEGVRTFVKVSISYDKYNLIGNAHNYLFPYNWEMKERGIQRNHTSC